MADNFDKDILFQALQEQEMPERVFGKKKGFPYIFESGTSSAFGPYQIQYGLMEDVRDNLGSLKKQAGINVPDGFNSYLIKLIRDSKNKFNASNNLEYNGKVPSKKIFGPLKEGTIKKELHEKYYPILAELALESKKNILANKNKPISLENISKAWHGNTIAKKNDEYASIIKDNYTSIQRSTALDKEYADDVYKIGEDTGTKTIVGKPVFKTPQGENVSERSVTFKVGGKYINAPSIQDGVEYSEDEIRDKYIRGELKSTSEHGNIEDALLAAKTRSDTLLPEKELDKQTQNILDASAFTDTEINMNEGGMAKNQYDQLEMFADGGLYEEGGMVDDESGNEVPPGSLKEEVRDDIPANLSEGEFVFPADVVRYWGLDTLMRMRQKAKAGLKRMEAMGQMGNADEATMPDDLPFDINDLELEDEQEELNFQTGGLATNPLTQNAMGNFMGSAVTDPNQMYGPMYTPLGYPSTQQTPEASATAPMEAASARYMQPSQYAYQAPSFTYTPEKEVMPTFRETTGMGVSGIDYETLTYTNEAGDTLIRYRDKKTGKLYDEMFQEASVPDGYTLKTEVTPEEVTTETAKVADTGGGGREDDAETPGATIAFGGTPATGSRKGLVDNAFSANVSFTGMSPKGFLGAGASSLVEAISGGKYGQALSLSGSQGAVLSNIKDPSTKRGVSPASTLGFNLAMNADQYNKYVSRSGPVKVTDRQQLAGIVQQLAKIDSVLRGETISMDRASYLAERIRTGNADEVKDSIQKGKDLNKQIADALGRGRGTVPGSGIFGSDVFGRTRTGAVSAVERAAMTPAERARVDAVIADYVAKMDTSDDEEEGPTPGPTPSEPSPGTSAPGAGYTETVPGGGEYSGTSPAPAPAPAPVEDNYNYGDHDSNDNSNDGPGSNDSSGMDGTYICTASYANGLIAHDHFTSLKKYGIMLRRNDPYLMKAYDWFGPALASAVRKGKLAGFAKHTTDMWKYNQTKQSDAPFEIKFMSYFHKAITRPALRILGRCLTVKEKLYK